jgi:hypothetical protein
VRARIHPPRHFAQALNPLAYLGHGTGMDLPDARNALIGAYLDQDIAR